METIKMNVSRQCSIVRVADGLTVYEMRPSCVREDQEKKIQVMTIGPMNKGPIKSVLLLGQTGAGKTRVIDAMINHLFGVKFKDNCRFQLKDQVGKSDLTQVESQTEYITAYIVYYQAGMEVNCNYMLIDTPGFSDTREGYDNVLVERLTHFVKSDYGIDELNCVALVAQATQNRIVKDQIEMLEEFTSVLGSNIGVITRLLATFASNESSAVVEVVKRAGVQFVNSYHLDNGVLFDSPRVDASDPDKHDYLQFRWKWMQREYTKFFKELQRSPPVNLKQTRDLLLEKELLKGTERKLKNIVMNIAELKKKKKNLTEDLREISDEKDAFIRTKTQGKALIKKKSVMNGHHAHNCEDCMQTCLDYCEDPSNAAGIALGISAGLVTAASGAAVGAEVGVIGGPLGLAAGTATGLLIGIGTALLTERTIKDCRKLGFNGGCDKCSHSEESHEISVTKYVLQMPEDLLDACEKKKFDNFQEQIKKLETYIKKCMKDLQDLEKKVMIPDAKALVEHTKKINMLSMKKSLTPYSIIEDMIKVERENTLLVECLLELKKVLMKMS